MSRFKIFSLILIILLFKRVYAQEKSNVQRPKPRAESKGQTWRSDFGFGVGYLLWSEKISLKRAEYTSEGISNYAGPSLFAEWRRQSRVWIFAISGEVASGKAASGGYSGRLQFEDGIDRNWSSFGAGATGLYRLNPLFSMGMSFATQYRTVDWEPRDPTLTVEARSAFVLYPKIDLRLRANSKIEFSQSYAPLSFEGESLWNFGFQYFL